MKKINSCKQCDYYYQEQIDRKSVLGTVPDRILGKCNLKNKKIIYDDSIFKEYALCENNQLSDKERIDIYIQNMFEDSIDKTIEEIILYLWLRGIDIFHDGLHLQTHDLFKNMEDAKLYIFNKYIDMFQKKFDKVKIIKNALKK